MMWLKRIEIDSVYAIMRAAHIKMLSAPFRRAYRSIFSRVGAFDKPGAIHSRIKATTLMLRGRMFVTLLLK